MIGIEKKTRQVEYWSCGDESHTHATEKTALKCHMRRKAKEKREAKYKQQVESLEEKWEQRQAEKRSALDMLNAGMKAKQIAENLKITPQKAGRLIKSALQSAAWDRAKAYDLNRHYEIELTPLLACSDQEWKKNKPIFEKRLAEMRKDRNQWRERSLRKLEAQRQAKKKAEKKQLAREEEWIRAFLMSNDGIAASRIAQTFDVTERTAREYVKRGRLVIATRRMSQHHKGWYAKGLPKEDQQALATMTDKQWEFYRWQLAARDFKNIREQMK